MTHKSHFFILQYLKSNALSTINGKDRLQLMIDFINPERAASADFTVVTLVYDRLSLIDKSSGGFIEYMRAK